MEGEAAARPGARLYRVIRVVDDIDGAARFYGHVLEDPGERISPGRHYFDCGGVVLACYDPRADGDEGEVGGPRHANEYVYLSVPDVDAARERVRAAGAAGVTAVEHMPWGERLFYAVDPFGNPLSFVQRGTEFVGTAPRPDPRGRA